MTTTNPIQDYGDLHETCVGVLALCLEEGEGMSALQGSNCLATLLEHVGTGSTTGMRRSAVSGGGEGGRLWEWEELHVSFCFIQAQALAKAARNGACVGGGGV